MTHGLSRDEWIDYLDGGCTPEQRKGIEAHLMVCSDCRELAACFGTVDTTLQWFAQRLREDAAVQSEEIAAALRKTLERTGDRGVSAKIGMLYFLLASMCGEKVSGRVIRSAAHRAVTASSYSLKGELWPGFLDHLHSIVAPLCGEPAATLIRTRGMDLERGTA